MMGGPIELLTMMDKVSKEPKSLGEMFRAQLESPAPKRRALEASFLNTHHYYSINI